MPCAFCEKRRKLLRNAYCKDGMKGVAKVLPKVGRTIIGARNSTKRRGRAQP